MEPVTTSTTVRMYPGELDLEPGINLIAERAQALTGATGAAIALRNGCEIICRARSGRTAPDIGVRLQTDSGISADCVRTGEVVLCHDAERNPQVDLASCRRLGVRSILAAPRLKLFKAHTKCNILARQAGVRCALRWYREPSPPKALSSQILQPASVGVAFATKFILPAMPF